MICNFAPIIKIKMKKLFTAIVVLLLLSSCKKESLEIATKEFNVSNFNKLNMGSNFQINVIKASSFSLKAEGRKRDIDDMKAEVQNGELKIRFTDIVQQRERVKVSISMPSLTLFNFDGNSRATVSNFTEATDIQGFVSGNTKVILNASALKFKFDLSGNSELTVNGNAEWVKANVSGNSFLNTYGVAAKNGEAVATDNSKIKIYTSISLNASSSSNSHIYFKGNPGGRFFAESGNSKIIEE
jgi:hypothetical protein